MLHYIVKEYFQNKSILITGGCGFIGSHLVDRLNKFDTRKIDIIDNLSSSNICNLEKYSTGKLSLFKEDIKDIEEFEHELSEYDILIHLAAQPSVPVSVENPFYDFKENVLGSIKMLEYARKNNIDEFIFAASGGTVYGEVDVFPTPERHDLRPISNYGAAKAAVEMYLSSFAELYGMKTTSLRFGNVFGERSTHGVMHDFYVKLKQDPKVLEILGNGEQIKSYLYIEDCVNGFLYATSRPKNGFEAYNMAGKPPITVNNIANFISKIKHLNPKFTYTGGKRGWNGDVVKTDISTEKLEKLGWRQEFTIKEGIERYIRWLEENLDIKENEAISIKKEIIN